MDRTTEAIVAHATTLRYEDLTPEAIRSLKRSFIDSIGCALGASAEDTALIAKKVARHTSSDLPARILGADWSSSPEMAAFANTVMVHYLNFDPGWRDLHQAGGFPGRTIPAILALADPLGHSGRDVITAAVVAYDVCYRLVAKMDLHIGGWNQSLYTAIASAAGLANLLGLTPDQARNAVSLTAINSLRLRQTRSSSMPMWKNADCADGNRAAIHYVLLAREGMTAPSEPFEGQWGVWRQPGVAKEDLEPFGKTNDAFKVVKLGNKIFPTHHHGIPAISMALELRGKVSIDDIEKIDIKAYRRALYNVGGGPDKPQRLDPQTREDADHSIPWLVAVALRDGRVTGRSFWKESLLDPALRPLMRKIRVSEDPVFTSQYPAAYPMSMEIVTRSGERSTAETKYYKGHPRNPLTDQEVEAKFTGLAEDVLGKDQCRAALDVMWRLEELETMSPLFEALAPSTRKVLAEVRS